MADRLGNRVGCQQSPLLMATGAEAPLPATKGNEHFMVAVVAADPGKAKVEIAAGEEFSDHLADDRPPRAVAISIALLVGSLELGKMALD